jgi:nitroreductase
MDFFEVIESRHSIREYSAQAVSDEALQKIFETINRAPSAGNLQAFEVYVVRREADRQALVRAAGEQEFLGQAPVVLVFCAHWLRSSEKYGRRAEELYAVQDATIACTFAMLAAAALGLASVWVGAFDEAAVREIIGAPSGQRPVAMLPLGYAAGGPRHRPRRNLSDLVHEVG